MSERSERIIGLAMQRMRPSEIAKTVGVSVNSVYSAVYEARKSGVKIPAFKKGSPKFSPVLVPTNAVQKYRRAARVRGLTPDEMIEKVLVAIADDGLIAAVLDDGAADV